MQDYFIVASGTSPSSFTILQLAQRKCQYNLCWQSGQVTNASSVLSTSESKDLLQTSWPLDLLSVADLGFPRGGGLNPTGGTNIKCCKFFPKTAWNWKNLDPLGAGGRASLVPPLDPPLIIFLPHKLPANLWQSCQIWHFCVSVIFLFSCTYFDISFHFVY